MSRNIPLRPKTRRARSKSGPISAIMRSPWELLALLVAAAAVIYLGAHYLSATAEAPASVTQRGTPVSLHFDICAGPQRFTCVVDGDTIWLEGTNIRIADINTPEISSPRCNRELDLGNNATHRLTGLLNAAPFEVLPYERDEDRYGRKLRILSRDGRSIGQTLVAEGLAESWGGTRIDWCA